MRRFFQAGVAATLAALAIATSAQAQDITNDQIRDVVNRVARHQLVELSDGDYAPVSSLEQAKAARAPTGIVWIYPHAVGLYGMSRSTDITHDQQVSQFVVRHYQIAARYYHWLAGIRKQFGDSATDFVNGTALKLLMKLGSLDSCGAMGNAMLDAMMRHPETVTAEEREVLARVADWVVSKQGRMPDGTLWRPEQNNTVWPDDLYMGGVFLVRYGLYTHDVRYIDDAARNIIHQAALEQDSDGLWFHGWLSATRSHAPFKWGRGNGWVTIALVETLSALPDGDPLRPQLIAILKRQIDGLRALQAPSGMWRQVLDKPELWEETSSTAMFAYGIARAVNRGWLPASDMTMARHAFAGVAKNVTPDGRVENTCAGTNIGTTLDFYINRPRPDNDPHGPGPVLLAGTEILMAAAK
ncbi:MAG TPA: glycoside hydrolase family 88 protein [Rhizomicrobium sp.]|nr:glycoside hydrolase family 88 protein [Rhizomicrobium sp.]